MTNQSPFEINRRKLLQLGSAGVLGLSLPELLALKTHASGGSKPAVAKNVLVVLEQGGMSHIDTWDPKPEMPVDHRSSHKPISTVVPGMQFTELLSKTAQIADKLSVIRSMYHPKAGANGHPQGTQYTLSGAHPASVPERPDISSVVTHLMGSECGYLPPAIMVPGNHEQAKESRTGFLPGSTRVFKTGGRDVSDENWTVDGLLARQENSDGRFAARQKLLGQLEHKFTASDDQSSPFGGMDSFYEQAFETLGNPRVSAAFEWRSEPESIKAQYGSGHRGACYLVGRKLIEAGVRFVTVDVRWPRNDEYPMGTNLNWDHHDFIYASGTCNLPGAGGGGRGRYGIGTWPMMGSVDHAFSALITDMEQRGLLEETLVCFVTEFGRTPKLNKAQGRDHWTHAYSIAMAGAGVPGGQVIGKSDHEGGYVEANPHTPEEYASTIYEKLGIDRDRPIYTPANRPVFFGHAGEPIAEVL
ncbi:MAG: DUF1501 domain-containing protein [Planctomycetaceae bacterium]|jgi:hypothetical protein|nr:DUF1501 domain-containing protein [bacterium]MDB4786704.1 DUF1501 domain-containing protein [Planctomycetaceae bacterium]MDG2391565.1 DUF1501 domain-containing protein [Planctomycetaceae bacterium]